MTQENNFNNQESVVVEKVDAGLTPERIAELNEKFEQPTIVNNSKLAEEFPGSVIVKKIDGTHFAVRKNPQGEWEGNSFKLTPDGGIGAVYQEHGIDNSIIKVVEDKIEKGVNEKLNNINSSLMSLFQSAGFSSFDSKIKDATEKIKQLSDEDQEKLAERFHEDTIGRSIGNIPAANQVYMQTDGAFSRKFKEIESARLKGAGYSSGLTI